MFHHARAYLALCALTLPLATCAADQRAARPVFFVSEDALRLTMHRIARSAFALELTLRDAPALARADARQVAELLDELDAAVDGIDPGGQRTNREVLAEVLPIFRAEIASARRGADALPPRLFEASKLTKACARCHEEWRESPAFAPAP